MTRPTFADLIQRLTGRHVYKHLPRGVNLTSDITRLLPDFDARTIFDVGANVGETALQFHKAFPTARIFAFEPVPDTFAQLSSNVKGLANIKCVQLAASSINSHRKMAVGEASDRASIVSPESGEDPSHLIDVPSATLDRFVRDEGINVVDLLKIDTEGHELEVLQGAEQLLTNHLVKVIIVEAAINPLNHNQIGIAKFLDYFSSFSYLPFAVYDQVQEWPTDEPFLRRCNCAFISQRIYGKSPTPAH